MSRRGFTLIEVLTAVAITAMISTVIYTAFSQTSKTREAVGFSEEQSHEIRTAFSILTEDLAAAYLSLHRNSLKLVWDTVFMGQDNGDEDRLDFAAFTHRRMVRNANAGDQAELSYYLAPEPGEMRLKRLIRRESSLLDTEPKEGGTRLVLVRRVLAFNLEYYDRPTMEWLPSWDTTQALGQGDRLPEQVRIRLVVAGRLGHEKAYVTQTAVTMREPLLLNGFQPGPGIMGEL